MQSYTNVMVRWPCDSHLIVPHRGPGVSVGVYSWDAGQHASKKRLDDAPRPGSQGEVGSPYQNNLCTTQNHTWFQLALQSLDVCTNMSTNCKPFQVILSLSFSLSIFLSLPLSLSSSAAVR